MDAATVSCPQCGFENRQGSLFCAGCAAPMSPICPACGRENVPGARFCDECASPLSPAPVPASPQEERRLVTALFCDLVGFTPLSERLDPEEIRDIQAEYFGRMAEQVERFGGTVEKYAGDAVLALFGVPVSHEDDAERAVLCALGMQHAFESVAARVSAMWQVEPAIRVGVNSGEAVSGTWNASGRQDVAVTGDAVNTAARLQSAAEPGEILVGAETMRLTRRRILYSEHRDVALKGKLDTVPVWPALGIREEFGERWEGYDTPLMGRVREMVGLRDAWARALGGEGQLVTIVGDAGVGKSRLVAELLSTNPFSADVRVVRGRCLSYGQQISFWLVADLVRSFVAVREQDGLNEIEITLREAMPALLLDSETREEARDVLGEVLGLPVGESPVAQAGPQIRRQALIRSLRAVLGAVAERSPTVLVLEDLHWIDTSSQEVLSEVLADAPGLRLLVLATQRPGWAAPWSEWGWPERLTLRPLEGEDASALAGAVLGGVNLSRELETYAAERAGGNPFFVEEILRSLQETGGIEEREGILHIRRDVADRLPATLTGVLLARLDRLEEQVKSLAQVASVIGRTFAVRLLAEVVGKGKAVLEMPLAQLQRAEIAFPRRSPDLEYVFKHVTMRDVAYNMLVQRRRRELHLQTARAIASLYPSDEYVEIIAYHYTNTDAAEAATWLERAGDRAARIYSNEAAIAHYAEARKRLDSSDLPALCRVDEKLGGVLVTVGRYDEALPVLERAVEAYRSTEDLQGAGRVTVLVGAAHRDRGTPEEGLEQVRSMITLLREGGASPALADLYGAQASLLALVGRYGEILEIVEPSIEVARAIGDVRLLGVAEFRRAAAIKNPGRQEEAFDMLQRALPLIEEGGDLTMVSVALNSIGDVCGRLGRFNEMRVYMERAATVAERIGNPGRLVFALQNVGEALRLIGDWETGEVCLARAVALAQSSGQRALGAHALGEVGLLQILQGRWTEARQTLEEVSRVAEEVNDRQLREYLHSGLAELDVLEGRPQDAVSRLWPLVTEDSTLLGILLPPLVLAYLALDSEEALRHAEQAAARVVAVGRGEKRFLPDALRVQGMVLSRQGHLVEAETVFAEGLDIARLLPYPYAEARILDELGPLERQRGEPERAQERVEQALAIFRRLGAGKDIERTEQLRSDTP